MAITVIETSELEELLERVVRKVVGEGGVAAARSPEVLTTDQAAEIAGVSAKTVREWISAGKLPAGRRGQKRMILRADLTRYLGGKPPDGGPVASLLASLTKRSA